MVPRMIILSVITIISVQSNDFVKVKNRILPEYRFNLRNNLPPNNVIEDDFNTRQDENYNDNGNYNDNVNYNDNANFNDRTSEEIGQANSRRLFEWFSKLFHTTTPKIVGTSTTTTESSYTRDLKERIFFRELHRNLTDTLQKITEIQKRVSDVVERREESTFLKTKPTGRLQNYFRRRFKRDKKSTVEDTTVIDSEIKSLNDTKNFTDTMNSTTIRPCAEDSGRRSGSDINPTEIKNKLLLYLEESFQEIENKITALKNVKEAFNNNESFKIGYIIANIDTLEVSMLNLKRNVDDNKRFWEYKKILDLYDTLKVSNQAVTGLIESLKMYIEKLSTQS